MLSGMVLYHVYHRKIVRHPGTWRGFFFIRILRLCPVHLLCLLLVPLCVKYSTGTWLPADCNGLTLAALFGQISLLNGIVPGGNCSLNPPSWSISIQLFTGSLLVILSCLSRASAPLVALVAASLGYYWQISVSDGVLHHHLPLRAGIFRCLYCMPVGIMAYQIISHYSNRLTEYEGCVNPVACFGLILLCLTIANCPLSLPEYLWLTPVVALTIMVISTQDIRAISFLSGRPLMILGERAYSLYLLHMPVIYALLKFKSDGLINQILLTILTLILCIIIARFTVAYIEKPCLRFAKSRLAWEKG